MAVLIAKECFVGMFQRFVDQLTMNFPNQTKHCQKYIKEPVDKLFKWAPRLTLDAKDWVKNDKGQILEFRTIQGTDDQLLYFMKYLCNQFYPYEDDLLVSEINEKFFQHPQNELLKHLNLHSVWKVARLDQKQWIWEQMNILYLVAVSLKQLPQEVFVHFHKLLESTTQGLLSGQESRFNIKNLRDQALQILKEVGEDKFRVLMRYFFMLLQCPYSPIPELVPVKGRKYAKNFLCLLRSKKGVRIIQKGMTPFLRLAKDEFSIPIEIPNEKDLVGTDGKMDEKKVGSAFKTFVEKILDQPEEVWQKILDDKETVIEKVKGTWNSLLVPKTKEKKISLDIDSDEEEENGEGATEGWVGVKSSEEEGQEKKNENQAPKKEGEDEEEEEEEGDITDDLLEIMTSLESDKSCDSYEMPKSSFLVVPSEQKVR